MLKKTNSTVIDETIQKETLHSVLEGQYSGNAKRNEQIIRIVILRSSCRIGLLELQVIV